MSKKMCGLFVVPLLLVCVLSSCGKKEPEQPKTDPTPVAASVTFDPPVEPPELVQRNHCLEVTGYANDAIDPNDVKTKYRYCYYPYSRKDVGAGDDQNRFRCSTAVKDCDDPSKGVCSQKPNKQHQC